MISLKPTKCCLPCKLQQQHLIDLEDAAVVVRNTDGTVHIKQSQPLSDCWSGQRCRRWEPVGDADGPLVPHPLMGAVIGAGVGAGAGAVSGALTDIGIDDDFIKATAETLQPGTSALFVLVRQVTPDRVIDAVKPYNPKVLHSSLSDEG